MISLGTTHIASTCTESQDLRHMFPDKLLMWLRNSRQYNGGGIASVTETRWDDVSGRDNHCTIEAEDSQPAVDLGGLHMDGSNDYMDFSSTIEFATETPFCIIMVVDLDGNSNEVITSDGVNEFIEILTITKLRIKTEGTGSGNIISAFTAGTNTWLTTEGKIILTITRATTGELNIYKNGAVVAGTWSNQTNAGAIQLQNLGCRNDADRFFDGKMYEFAIISEEVNDTKLEMMHDYYKKIFNIS